LLPINAICGGPFVGVVSALILVTKRHCGDDRIPLSPIPLILSYTRDSRVSRIQVADGRSYREEKGHIAIMLDNRFYPVGKKKREPKLPGSQPKPFFGSFV
jgi:hypothetical protein